MRRRNKDFRDEVLEYYTQMLGSKSPQDAASHVWHKYNVPYTELQEWLRAAEYESYSGGIRR